MRWAPSTSYKHSCNQHRQNPCSAGAHRGGHRQKGAVGTGPQREQAGVVWLRQEVAPSGLHGDAGGFSIQRERLMGLAGIRMEAWWGEEPLGVPTHAGRRGAVGQHRGT